MLFVSSIKKCSVCCGQRTPKLLLLLLVPMASMISIIVLRLFFISWKLIVFPTNGTSQDFGMVLASMGHRGAVSRHRETLSSWFVAPDPVWICSLLQPASCFSLLPQVHSLVETTRQAPAQGKKVELRQNPQCALSGFSFEVLPLDHALDHTGTCIRVSVPLHHHFRVTLGPIPYLTFLW